MGAGDECGVTADGKVPSRLICNGVILKKCFIDTLQSSAQEQLCILYSREHTSSFGSSFLSTPAYNASCEKSNIAQIFIKSNSKVNMAVFYEKD